MRCKNVTTIFIVAATVICPKTIKLSWVGSGHKAPYLQAPTASQHSQPAAVKGLRSFVGAYKVLSRVLPDCSQLVDALKSAMANLQSHDHVKWDECLRQRFTVAQDALSSHKSILLPRASDQLWIVTDGSVTKLRLGATLYVISHDLLYLAGFYSSKLRKHQVRGLPRKVETLSIAAAVKNFSPVII